MKKKLLIVAMLVVVIMTTVLLAGCSGDKMQLGFMESAEGTPEYVKVNIKDYEGKTLADLLKGEESLGAKLEDSAYGPFVTEIKGMKQDTANNIYFMIYTNLQEFKDEWSVTKEINGETFHTVSVGISQLPINKDAKYIFVLEKSQY